MVNVFELALYCTAVVVMIATPGPVMLLVASAGLKGGYKQALKTIFGTNLASLVLIVLSVLILKGFLNIAEHWLNAIKILGCVYIAYLGFQILKEAIAQGTETSPVQLKRCRGALSKVSWWVFRIRRILFSLPHFSHSSLGLPVMLMSALYC